jgi:hypothetical protein
MCTCDVFGLQVARAAAIEPATSSCHLKDLSSWTSGLIDGSHAFCNLGCLLTYLHREASAAGLVPSQGGSSCA